MCVALPGVVRRLYEDQTADVDFSGNIVRAAAGLVPVEPGDSVLVHAGCIMQVVEKDESDELAGLFEEIRRIWGVS